MTSTGGPENYNYVSIYCDRGASHGKRELTERSVVNEGRVEVPLKEVLRERGGDRRRKYGSGQGVVRRGLWLVGLAEYAVGFMGSLPRS